MLKKDKEWILNIFKFRKSFPLITINSIGRHKITSPEYYWDGMKRPQDGTYCLFQYTISGNGEIKIDNNIYKIKKNEAFFIKIPSNHTYYLPKNTSWEVLYIEFSIETENLWKEIVNNNEKSQIFKFNPHSKFISLLWETFYAATNGEIDNVYKCSQYSYNLLFELLNQYYNTKKKNSSTIENIKKFIKKNYSKPISIEDISNFVNLSKFHLSRRFKEEVGISHWQYIIKIRLKNATDLLLNSNMNIEEISEKVGFSCGNYFSKAFKHKFKISPTEYRNYYKNYYKVSILSK